MSKKLPPDVEVSTELTIERNIKVSVGIKNNFPATDSNGRWSSIAPFISVSFDVPEDADIEAAVGDMYERMLPAYGFMMLQEFMRLERVNKTSIKEEAFALMGMKHGE